MEETKQYSVYSSKNSECGSARLKDLNWGEWWMDTSNDMIYLHVAGKDGETSHRVFCRHTDKPRLAFSSGALYWIVDPPSHTASGDQQ